MFCTQRKSLNCMKLQASFAVNESRKTSSRFAVTIRLGLSATIRQMLIFRIVNETCKLTSGNKLPVGLNPPVRALCSALRFRFHAAKTAWQQVQLCFFVYSPNSYPNSVFSDKFTTQKKSAKKYPRLKIPAYYICKKEIRLQKGRKKYA